MLDQPEIHPLFHGAPASTGFRKLRKRIVRLTREAIETYGMDRDWPLARLPLRRQGQLHAARRPDRAPLAWPPCRRPPRLQPRPGPARLPGHGAARVPDPHGGAAPDRVPRHLLHRHRQGARGPHLLRPLLAPAPRPPLPHRPREDCSAVVLGHHQGDIVETFRLSLFFGGRLAAMPPKLLNDEGDLYVLRPLAHVAEGDCERFARTMGYLIIPCDLCGSQHGLKRRELKRMLDAWEERSPGRRQSLFRALTQASPSHLLDSAFFDFRGLKRRGIQNPDRSHLDI